MKKVLLFALVLTSCINSKYKFILNEAQQNITFGTEDPTTRRRELRKKIAFLIAKRTFIMTKMGNYYEKKGCDSSKPHITHSRCIKLRRIYTSHVTSLQALMRLNIVFMDFVFLNKKPLSKTDRIKIEKVIWYVVKIAEAQMNPEYMWWVNNEKNQEPNNIPQTKPLPNLIRFQ